MGVDIYALMAAQDAAKAGTRPTTTVTVPTPVTGGTAYGLAALADEAHEVAATLPGGRNQRLNVAAFKLGTLVAAGHLDANLVRDTLTSAARACGLDDRETAATIASGGKAGLTWPRQVPDQPPAPDVTVLAPTATSTDADDSDQQTVDPGWAPIDLSTILAAETDGSLKTREPTVGVVDDGHGLFYTGCVNGLAGESGGGKTWIAMTVGAEQMRQGRDFWYVDFEDTPETAVLRLVRILGVPSRLVEERFRYVQPRAHDPWAVMGLVAQVAAGPPDPYVVVDSTGEALALAGLKQNADEDVAGWFREVPGRLARDAGATVVLLDHMVKADD
ncbi:MAG: AAA family ATPase, partial [Cellulomonas sp.]|nr:AAA family ATPase [Cellulomonas sp.]